MCDILDVGDNEEFQFCNTHNCPVYFEWSTWSDCSRTCGGGARERTRDCVWGSNAECQAAGGINYESENCNSWACPRNHHGTFDNSSLYPVLKNLTTILLFEFLVNGLNGLDVLQLVVLTERKYVRARVK